MPQRLNSKAGRFVSKVMPKYVKSSYGKKNFFLPGFYLVRCNDLPDRGRTWDGIYKRLLSVIPGSEQLLI
jgi:hypothetical protein